MQVPWPAKASDKLIFRTPLGASYEGIAEAVLADELSVFEGKLSLILTSPPFPLNRKSAMATRAARSIVNG
jgi:hypothetical protein